MKFMALGGTDTIGTGSFWLSLSGQSLLLDCGRGACGSRSCTPAFDKLLEQAILSLPCLDAVLLSHGHLDHAGALPDLLNRAPQLPVYGTALTGALLRYLLFDKVSLWDDRSAVDRLVRTIAHERTAARLRATPFRRPFQLGRVRATMYEAGHVPGAAMFYLESPEGSVLYTGDFNPRSTALTPGACLPDGLHCDVLVLCGTHARHPGYTPRSPLAGQREQLGRMIRAGQTVYLPVAQLTKGVETAAQLSRWFPDTPIRLEPGLLELAHELERNGLQAATARYGALPEHGIAEGPAFCIGSRRAGQGYRNIVQADFTLHGSFRDCEDLIRAVSPGTVFLVHAPRDRYGMADNALAERFPDITFISPEIGHLYDNS